MKKKSFIILFIISLFMFICPVMAEDETDPTVPGGPGDSGDVVEEVTTTTTTTKTTTTKKTTTTVTTKSKSSNNYLSKILVDGKRVEDFDKTVSKYEFNVDYDTKRVRVKAIAEDDAAEVEVDGPSSLAVGENEYTIGVTSEDNSTKYYKLIVIRGEKDKTSSTKLKSIKVEGYKFDFDKNSKTFYLKIDEEDTELDITVKTVDSDAKVKITGNEDLEDGSIIKINVTTSDDTKATYRIIIEKKSSNPLPIIIIGIITLVIIGVIIYVLIQKKQDKKKNKNKNKKPKKEEYYEDESEASDVDAYDDDELERTKTLRTIDNDEEEKTRMLNPDDLDDLEKTKIITFDSDDDDDY